MDAFELENPDIRVQLEYYGEDDSLEDIMATDGTCCPNLIMADSRLLYRLSFVNDLDTLLTEELLTELGSGMYTGARKAFIKQGDAYGLPYSAWLQVLWYRTDWFEQNGLRTPDEIETILNAAVRFDNPEISRFGIVLGEQEDSYLEQCFLQLSQAEGLRISKDSFPYTLNHKALSSSMELYSQLSLTSAPGKDNWRSRDYFFQNRAAMLFYSTFLMDDLALEKVMIDSLGSENFPDLAGCDYDPEFFNKVGMVTAITGERTASFGSISGIGIFSGTDKREQENIRKLVRFLYRPDVYISWLHMSPGGMLPVNRETLELDDFYRDSGGVLRRFGRERIRNLVGGLEYLEIVNPEELRETLGNDYGDKDFQKIIIECLENPSQMGSIIDKQKWIK